MKRVDLIKTVEGSGCVLVRHGAKHDWYRNPDTGVLQAVPRQMKFKIALYPTEEGFAASALNLPGCWSQGENEEEALANIIDAIREFLEAEVEPEPGERVLIREVDVAWEGTMSPSG